MSKELPKMYQNRINKPVKNRQEVYMTFNHNDKVEKINTHSRKTGEYSKFAIEQKIYNIFNAPDYIYKADVIIELDNETIKKRIVGKTKTHLITIDNEYIEIAKIKDIYK